MPQFGEQHGLAGAGGGDAGEPAGRAPGLSLLRRVNHVDVVCVLVLIFIVVRILVFLACVVNNLVILNGVFSILSS